MMEIKQQGKHAGRPTECETQSKCGETVTVPFKDKEDEAQVNMYPTVGIVSW